MAFEVPSLSELAQRVRDDISSRVFGSPGVVPRKSAIGYFADGVAAAVRGLYFFQNWLSQQVIPDTAEDEWLERWAAVWGLTRQPGNRATGNVTITGTGTVSAGTALRTTSGLRYLVTADTTAAPGGAACPVESELVGEQYNIAAGTKLTFETPVSGVDTEAVVDASGITGGADEESTESLRERLLLEIQRPPQGGSAADYERWARAAHVDVTRVFVREQIGVVTVYVVADTDAGDIVPSAGTLQAVDDYIQERRPLGLEQVDVVAPAEAAIDMTIALSPNTTEVQQAVQAELIAMLQRRSAVEFGGGEGVIRLSWISEAISIAAGEDAHSLISPAADVTPAVGELAKLGTITWQAL